MASNDFIADLTAFVQAWVAAEDKKRRYDERMRSLEAEIVWLQKRINELEPMLTKRPSTIRQINDLKHQLRQHELDIAFLEK
jgi:predicted  nucleic acid-binding Zn-ribbon protein